MNTSYSIFVCLFEESGTWRLIFDIVLYYVPLSRFMTVAKQVLRLHLWEGTYVIDALFFAALYDRQRQS